MDAAASTLPHVEPARPAATPAGKTEWWGTIAAARVGPVWDFEAADCDGEDVYAYRSCRFTSFVRSAKEAGSRGNGATEVRFYQLALQVPLPAIPSDVDYRNRLVARWNLAICLRDQGDPVAARAELSSLLSDAARYGMQGSEIAEEAGSLASALATTATARVALTCNLRADPDADAAILRVIAAGESVVVVGRRGPWVGVRTASGVGGWMHTTCFALAGR